jgi:hypothetical protein
MRIEEVSVGHFEIALGAGAGGGERSAAGVTAKEKYVSKFLSL